MSERSIKILIGMLLAAFFAISIFFRIVYPFDNVFSGEWIKYTQNDVYYYIRLIDSISHNFPFITEFDPFFIYPAGNTVSNLNFFSWFIAGIIWLVGLGSPTQQTVDVICVLIPPILAGLTIIPVYYIGKTLFNRWVGVLAAGLMAIFPGEFMGRSLLGVLDTPVAELFLTTTTMAFLIAAIKVAGERQLSFAHLIKRDWKTSRRPIVYSLLAGFFMGLYLDTWQGALLFVFIISVYFIIQFVIDHLKRRSSEYLGIIGFVFFLIAFLLYIPFSLSIVFSLALLVALLIPVVLAGVSRLFSSFNIKTYYYPITLLIIGLVFIGVFYAIKPYLLEVMVAKFGLVFNPGGATAITTQEMQQFLTPDGDFSPFIAWGQFTTSFFLVPAWAIPGFGIIAFFTLFYKAVKPHDQEERRKLLLTSTLVIMGMALLFLYLFVQISPLLFVAFAIMFLWLAIRQRDEHRSLMLFFIWMVIILTATFAQRRFSYYLVANIAVLAGYLSWEAIRMAGFGKLLFRSKETPEKARGFQEASHKPDYYEILGVSQRSSYKDVKKAYRKLTSELHQQLKPTPETEGRIKEVNEAYEVISNPERRSGYDRSRRDIAERKKVKSLGKGTAVTVYHLNTIIAIVLVFLLVFLQNIDLSRTVASQTPYAPTDGWQEALVWMDENTPQPLGDPDAYYGLYEAPPWGEDYEYPESAYSVTAWWDYGYWITRTAHRIPSANPSQEPEAIRKVANLFLSQDEPSANEIVEELDSSYIIADYQVATTKFHALATWADHEESQYYDVFVVPFEGEQSRLLLLYYLEYYNSLYVRLYNFNGEPVAVEKSWVITWEYATISGQKYKYITDRKGFSSYQEALEYQRSLEDGNHRIVGFSPFASPVPLEPVDYYRMEYSSRYLVEHVDLTLEDDLNYVTSKVPEIKIFEYLK